MSKFPRRSFLAGLSTIPFALWFEKYAAAAPAMIRYNVTSVNGQKMLKIYRDGVKLMVATAEPSLKPEARILWQAAKELHLIFSKIWRK